MRCVETPVRSRNDQIRQTDISTVMNIIQMNRPESFRLQWAKANNYINQRAFLKALHIFEGLASEGYSEAYVEIGNLFEHGRDDQVAQDLNAARSWYMKAIEVGDDPYGYIGLARLALNGHSEAGTPSDAIEYLGTAAKADNPVALTMLGTLYHQGRFVPKSLDKATEFYEMACAHGYVLPALYLARTKWESGHYWESLKMRVKTICNAYILAKNDRSDPRLWNYLP